MAFVRPIVYVYQQFQNVTVAPGTPDLNCCIVGPAYNIQDYPVDKEDIDLVDFVASGQTADAPCKADGTSLGRPDAGSDFTTVSDTSRPNHIAGAVLDNDSIQLFFDDAYIEVGHGTAGAIAENDYIFTDAAGDFSGYDSSGDVINESGAQKIAAGDRVVLTADPGGAAAVTVIKKVAYVVSATELALTSTKKATENCGTSAIKWRVEHQMDDQQVDSAYYAVSNGDITIKTGPFGILLTYQGTTWPVNYAKMYLGYRELRVDLDDVLVINSIDEVTADDTLIGRIDERNPLAAGLQVALANTGNPIQVFGVSSDDLTGHQSARDRMTSRSDIYALAPVTANLSGSDWVGVIDMWKKHCVDYAAYDIAKFRVVLGSYDILPTEKASAPASEEGWTMGTGTDNEVFVDPAVDTQFVTDEVAEDNLLDTWASTTGGNNTITSTNHIFSAAAPTSKALYGAIGEKRLRTKSDFASFSADSMDYMVRAAVLKSEGATPQVEASSISMIVSPDNALKARIQKIGTGAFADAEVGSVAVTTGSTGDGGPPTHNGAYVIIEKDITNGDWIDVEEAVAPGYADDANGTPSFEVKVYDTIAGTAGASDTGVAILTKVGAFGSVVPGDVAVILGGTSLGAISPMFVVVSSDDDTVTLATFTGHALNGTSHADHNVVFLRPISSNGAASCTCRKRLNRLRDDTASFTTTVEAGEDINIPYPAETNAAKWDTPTTQWPIGTVVNDNMLDAQLGDLEELAPELFIAGFDGDMPYRISIDLNRDAQVTELNTITASLASSRCVMAWPNEVYVSNLENALTEVQSKQAGQYLACAIGGMVSGLPSHQGFTYIGIGGIQQLFNSNFYFREEQLTNLRNGGWYVFKQDSSSSLPYSIHEVTTDVSAYAFGEFMNVKNFDYIALYLKEVLEGFLGKYNITPETLEIIRASLNAAIAYLKLRIFPKIGTPLLEGSITHLAQHETEVDRIEVNVDIEMPKVANAIGLHLLG